MLPHGGVSANADSSGSGKPLEAGRSMSKERRTHRESPRPPRTPIDLSNLWHITDKRLGPKLNTRRHIYEPTPKDISAFYIR